MTMINDGEEERTLNVHILKSRIKNNNNIILIKLFKKSLEVQLKYLIYTYGKPINMDNLLTSVLPKLGNPNLCIVGK